MTTNCNWLILDTKNVLTGIIDSPDTYVKIKHLFCQVLIWNLVKKRVQIIQDGSFSSHSSQKQSKLHKSKKNAVNDIEQVPNPKSLITFESLRPSQWSNNAFKYSRSNVHNQLLHYGYSQEWFDEAIRFHTEDKCLLNSNELQSLSMTYGNVANICFALIFPSADSISDTSPSSQSIYQIFNRELPSTGDELSEKTFFDVNQDLFELCIKSFQYSAKIAFDQVILNNENPTTTELVSTLQDFDQNWYFGSNIQPNWIKAVLSEKNNLFSIGKDLVKENYTSHHLTMKDMDVYICSMNRSTIEAIWSSLSLELFYLTNDDDERYSIQAHPIILRKLILLFTCYLY